LLGSLFKRLGAALQGRSSNVPPPWDSLFYAGDQSSPNAALLAKLKSFAGLGLLMVALAPLPVSAEGRDDAESSLFVETFETLKQGYCYDSKTSFRRWEWVMKSYCDSKGGVLLAKADCQKSVKQAGSTFCTIFRTNDRFKEASAEFKRNQRLREARARKDDILRAKKILAALGYYQSTEHIKNAAFSDRLSRAIRDFLESTSVTLKGEPVYQDALGRKHLSLALMEKLSEADQGYCFSPPYGKPQAVAAPREGWCLKASQERFARLSSAADCTADQGFLLPRDACRTDFGSTCKILRFDAAAAFLRGTEGEKEIHFASNATQCIDQGGLLISEKDCAEKRTTTTLLRQGYCRRIPAERLSAIKARWLAATAYCYLGESRYINKTRSACKDAGGIVLAPMYCAAFSSATAGSRCLSLNPAGDVYVKTELASRDGAGGAQATSVAKADKQPEEKNTGEADQALTAAEFETSPKEAPIATEQVIDLQKALAFFGLYKGSIDGDAGPNTQRAVNQWLKKQGRSLEEINRALIQEITTEAKVEEIRIANAEEEKQQAQKAKATEAAKQKEREERNQQLIALRSELLKDIVSARNLLADSPGYPQKADLEKTINEAIAILVLDDLEATRAGKVVLLSAIENLEDYRERQIALADAKKKEEAERQLAVAIEAEANRKAEEEKQKAEDARLAEEQSKNASDNLAGLSLEPMDKIFAVPETTNIRAAPKVLSDRVGRINAGESLTILAKVSGEHWYLVETDQGERGFVFADAITLASGEKKVAAKAKNPAIPDIDFGKYHALVIGNNAYRELPKLESAINDARAVGALLETQYGFEVELLTNATRSDIYGSLASMRRRVGSNENLLIYYAGHGWLDKEADEGYWMPIDAEEDNPSNWLSSANLISEIRRSKAKHILVVADSCFSGTLTRGLTIKTRTPGYLERIVDKKARTALTSGGLEPVMDSGGESNHSVFASAFLGVLNDNDAVLDGHQLFTLVRKKVIMGSEQTPGYGDIRRSGHDGGDFLFVRQ